MTPLTFILLSSCILTFIPLTLSDVIWNKPGDWNEGLPASISAFQTNSSFISGINMTAAYSRIDLSDPDLELKVVHSEVHLKTPLDYIKDEPNLVYVAMNGGYFNMTSNYSISLVISNSSVIAGGLTEMTEKFKNKATPYYPTRGAFGVHEDGTPELAWTYDIDHDSKVFAYPEPAPNCFDCAPKFVPSNSYPANGEKWNVTQAVGAGPMIMRDGKVSVTSEEELFYRPGKDVLNPRTGICVTKEKEVVFLVVDGRYELSGGLLIVDVGNLMAELGCTDALNLDGGGSTAMIVNGFVTNRPSDATGMRPVTSALLVVSKTKPNPHYKGHDWHKVSESRESEEERSSLRVPRDFEDILDILQF